MTTITQTLVQTKYAESAETTQYTAAGRRAIVDKFSAYSAAGGTLTVRIVPSGGTAGATNALAVKTLAAGETYTFPEIVGHTLSPGDFISTLAGGANTVVIRASGREIT